jgi:hypothetical protein
MPHYGWEGTVSDKWSPSRPSSRESAWGRAGSPSSGTNEHQKRFRDEADFNGSPGSHKKRVGIK